MNRVSSTQSRNSNRMATCVLGAFVILNIGFQCFGAQRNNQVQIVGDLTYSVANPKLVEAILSADIEAFDAIVTECDIDINAPIISGFRSGNATDNPIVNMSNSHRVSDALQSFGNYHLKFMGDFLRAPKNGKLNEEYKSVAYHVWTGKHYGRSIGDPGDIVDEYEYSRVDVSHFEFFGTPLMIACRVGNPFMVAKLLERNANPNIMFKAKTVSNSEITNIKDCERPFACALIDAATAGIFHHKALPTMWGVSGFDFEEKKSPVAIAKCIGLLVAHGAMLPPQDGKGRNALWDALAQRNEALLNVALAGGVDINSRDNHGKTVLDYCVRAASDKSRRRSDRIACERFAAFVRKAGGVCAAESEEDNEDSKDEAEANAKSRVQCAPAQQGGAATYGQGVQPQYGNSAVPGVGGTFSGIRQKKDNSAEIKMLELRLVDLRRQLEDAEHDSRMSGIQGIGTITTGMRVQNIMSQIQEVQGRLLRLQN